MNQPWQNRFGVARARLMTINSIYLAQWYHHPSETKPDKAKARYTTPSQQVGIRVSTNGAIPLRASVIMTSATRPRPAPPQRKTRRRTNRLTVRTRYRDVSTLLSVHEQYVSVRSRRREMSVRWLASAAGESQRPSTMLPPKRLKSGFNQARFPPAAVCVCNLFVHRLVHRMPQLHTSHPGCWRGRNTFEPLCCAKSSSSFQSSYDISRKNKNENSL